MQNLLSFLRYAEHLRCACLPGLAEATGERSFQLCWKIERKVRTSSRSAANSPAQTCAKSNSFSPERTAHH